MLILNEVSFTARAAEVSRAKESRRQPKPSDDDEMKDLEPITDAWVGVVDLVAYVIVNLMAAAAIIRDLVAIY
jgi:hypothetical protein